MNFPLIDTESYLSRSSYAQTTISLLISFSIHGIVLAFILYQFSQPIPFGTKDGRGTGYDVTFVSSEQLQLGLPSAKITNVEPNIVAAPPPSPKNAETSSPKVKIKPKTAAVAELIPTKMKITEIKKPADDVAPRTALSQSQQVTESTFKRVSTNSLQISSFGVPSGSKTSGGSSGETLGDGLGIRGSYEGTPGVIPPRAKRILKPPYPKDARNAGFEGKAIFNILISDSGHISDAVLKTSSGRGDCDQVAQQTILSDWRFYPARKHGEAVPWRQKVVVIYSLD